MSSMSIAIGATSASPLRSVRAPRPAVAPATYRRRRVGAVAFVVALVLSVGSMAQRSLADRDGDPASVVAVGQRTGYVVQPGDSMWSIAERFYPGSDVTSVVEAMVELHGGASIQVGDRLAMP